MGSLSKRWFDLRNLDMMSKELNLHIQGSASVNTYVGVMLTVIYFFFMLAVTGYEFARYFAADGPTIFSETYLHPNTVQVNLTEQNLLPFMIAYNGNQLILSQDIEEYVHIEVVQEKWITTVDANTGMPNLTLEEAYFPAVPCSSLTEQERSYYSYVSMEASTYRHFRVNGVCVKANDSLLISGMTTDPVAIDINYKIKPCILGALCKPYEVVQNFNFYLAFPKTILNLANYKKPKKLTSNLDVIYYLVPKTVQILTQNIGPSSIQDYEDGQTLLPRWGEKEFYFDIKDTKFTLSERNESQIVCNSSQVGPNGDGSCISYVEFILQCSQQYHSIKRSYQTLFYTFGVIGGVHNAIFLSLFILYSWYNDKVKNELLIDKVYPFLKKLEKEGDSSGASSSENKPTEAKTTSNNSSAIPLDSPLQAKLSKPVLVKESILKTILRKLCSRKKETRKQKYHKLALESIESNLDIINIIKELNNLKFLTAILLDSRQCEVFPILHFAQALADRGDKSANISTSQHSDRAAKPWKALPIEKAGSQLGVLLQEAVDDVIAKHVQSNDGDFKELVQRSVGKDRMNKIAEEKALSRCGSLEKNKVDAPTPNTAAVKEFTLLKQPQLLFTNSIEMKGDVKHLFQKRIVSSSSTYGQHTPRNAVSNRVLNLQDSSAVLLKHTNIKPLAAGTVPVEKTQDNNYSPPSLLQSQLQDRGVNQSIDNENIF